MFKARLAFAPYFYVRVQVRSKGERTGVTLGEAVAGTVGGAAGLVTI